MSVAASLESQVFDVDGSLSRTLKTFAADVVPAYVASTLCTFTIGSLVPVPALAAASWSYIGITSAVAAAIVSVRFLRARTPQARLNPVVQVVTHGALFAVVFAALAYGASITVLPMFRGHVLADVGVSAFLGAAVTAGVASKRANKRLAARAA